MEQLKSDFPIFKGNPVIYFDNASTTHKPQQVIDGLVDFYTSKYANVGRGLYKSGETATQLFEKARETVADFIGASPSEIIFTKGTTEGINFIASSWGQEHIQAGDEILVSQLEHHSNLIPWQQLAKRKKAFLKFIPVTDDGRLELDKLPMLLTPNTKLVAVSHVSNALGTTNDIKTIIKEAHKVGAKVLIDASQSVGHEKLNVHNLDCDFLVFSAHKMLGPTGIGVLYIKKDLHIKVPPYQFGGGMIYEADFCDASWLPAPQKYEAGTPPIAQAIGFAAAIDYLNKNINFKKLQQQEAQLCKQLIDGLSQMKEITIHGPIDQLKKLGHIVSFTVKGMHPHDVAEFLNQHGISVRAGHHCVQPLAKKMGIDASVRLSFYFYNTPKEIEQFLAVIKKMLQ